ncbi:ALP1-like protein [Tanacetum coccineum]|uniref:ALP1-like protein n=1 Tax=Tanacetum coccineum TaxID=301880 RepID=A0ABQ5D328_9ASTR
MNQNRTVFDIDEETDAFYLQKAVEYHEWLIQQEAQPTIDPLVDFGMLLWDGGCNNDIMFNNISVIDDLLDDLAPVVPYVVNGVEYRNGYYLADGIYPEWASFVKSFTVATDPKHTYFKQRQESARKDVELDEQWFDLSADLLRKALAITLVIPAHPFELPPSGNTVIDFVNELGYPEPVEIERLLAVTNPDPVLANAWGISQSQSEESKEESNSSPHSLWTEVFQGDNLLLGNAITTSIRRHVHHTEDDFILGNLKFVLKVVVEVLEWQF